MGGLFALQVWHVGRYCVYSTAAKYITRTYSEPALPAVADVFGETDFIFNFDNFAVVKDNRAGK